MGPSRSFDCLIMPVMTCKSGGKSGYKFGKSGKCFTGPGSRSKAAAQGRAIKSKGDQNEFAIGQLKRLRQFNPNRKPINNAKLPKWFFPRPAQIFYNTELNNHLDDIIGIYNRVILPRLPSIAAERDRVTPEAGRPDSKVDAFSDDIELIHARFELESQNLRLGEAAVISTTLQLTDNFNLKQWIKIQKSGLGASFVAPEIWKADLAKAFLRENIQLIKNMDQTMISQIEQKLHRGFRAGLRWEEIAKDIEETFRITKNRAKLIARDQVGKLNGDFTRFRQTGIGVKDYFWRTSRDEKVRDPKHTSKEGQKFSWKKAPADTGHPGHDVRCRCWAEPDFTPILETFIA